MFMRLNISSLCDVGLVHSRIEKNILPTLNIYQRLHFIFTQNYLKTLPILSKLKLVLKQSVALSSDIFCNQKQKN